MIQRCLATMVTMVTLLALQGCANAGQETPVRSGADTETAPAPLEVVPASEPLAPVAWTPAAVGARFELMTDPGELPYLALARSDGTERLPLEHTHVNAALNGMLAEVEVRQTYENSSAKAIEAVYTFPLPENSAVNFMQIVVGKRTITAEIDERQRARRRYTEAKREGFTAALLEQERPNVFTQSVANIPPGERIDVIVRYVQDLSYDQGQYEFVFPMVVGPRFMPGASTGTQSGSGTHADTDRVPDGSRISPPYMGKGERSAHDISIEVSAAAAEPIERFQAVTHPVVNQKSADGSLHLALAERASIPNRDFVLRYSTASAQPEAALYTSEVLGSGYFSLVVEPPTLDVEELVGRRELIFVVDVSGSMAGTPLALCRTAMRAALEGLRPQDTFNIITFSGHTTQAFPEPRPANRNNVAEALRVVDEMRAGGGTQMLNAIDAALAPHVATGRHRYVFFMTDGYVGNEAEILERSARFVSEYEAAGVRAKVFGFGVGSSPNRHLVSGLGQVGKGVSVYASTREDPIRAVNQFYHYIDRAILTDVRIDWGGLTASEVYPNEMPDLFASHPLVLHGRYTGKPDRPIRLVANTSQGAIELPVSVHPAKTRGEPSHALGSLWARAKIDELDEALRDGSLPDAQARITELGLTHRLVTRFTSFVAVDSSRRVSDGTPQQVVQPNEAPEGVDLKSAGGVVHRDKRSVVTISADVDEAKKDGDGESQPKPEPAPPPPVEAPMPSAPASPAQESSAAELESEAAAPAEESVDGASPTDEDYAAVETKRGCGCRIVGQPASGGLPLGLGLLGLWLARRRRQRAELALRPHA